MDKTKTNSIVIGNASLDEDAEAFNETYISDTEIDLNKRNINNFKNRTVGLVSFYNEISSKEDEDPIFLKKLWKILMNTVYV